MFVTLEGPEGAGKSTLASALADALRTDGHDVLLTREPGAGSVGKAIREILLHGENLDPTAELMLFLADRAQHVAGTIRPHLASGGLVLCDRYLDSTIVYQGYARGLNVDKLRELNAFATGGLIPDLTLLLDLDPRVGLGRLTNKDRLDAEPLEFHERVRSGFLAESSLDPPRFVTIDASQDPLAVLASCYSEIHSRLAYVK